MISGGRSTAENERVAGLLAEQRITAVRYFPLPTLAAQQPSQWDFGAWHQPTMGVELATERGEVFSAVWNEYRGWGFGVDLYDEPLRAWSVPEGAGSSVDVSTDVSTHPAWAAVVGQPVSASFIWDAFGTDRPPCPRALRLASESGSLWIVAADWEQQAGRFCIQLGLDGLMVIFDERFLEALGLTGRR